MKLKKLAALVLSGALLLSAAGCSNSNSGGSAAPQGSDGGGSAASDVKIGVLIPGSPTDGGFSQQGSEAGKALETNHGCAVSVVEAATAETIRQEAENMAAEGYKIVFGHGGQCASPFAEICEDYPDTWFVTIGGEELNDNLFSVVMCAEEGSYVLGVLAGLMTQSNVIGYTLGGDYPSYTKTTTGWALGAKSVNPDVEVLGAVLSATDANECAETTLNQIQSGADFILSNSNEGQAGAMKAVSESEGVYIFGCLGNFFDQAPGKVPMNVIGDYVAGYEMAYQAVMDGTATADFMYLTMANDAVTVEWNEELKAQFPEDVVATVEKTIEDIKAGTIDVPNEFEQDKAQEILNSYNA